MKTDPSKIIYDKYFSLSNASVEILLKNGRMIKGKIAGLFKSDPNDHGIYVFKWHIETEMQKAFPQINFTGEAQGEIVLQTDVRELKFLAETVIHGS